MKSFMDNLPLKLVYVINAEFVYMSLVVYIVYIECFSPS